VQLKAERSVLVSTLLEMTDHKERDAEQGVNFMTRYDGFALNDLVSCSVRNDRALVVMTIPQFVRKSYGPEGKQGVSLFLTLFH